MTIGSKFSYLTIELLQRFLRLYKHKQGNNTTVHQNEHLKQQMISKGWQWQSHTTSKTTTKQQRNKQQTIHQSNYKTNNTQQTKTTTHRTNKNNKTTTTTKNTHYTCRTNNNTNTYPGLVVVNRVCMYAEW